MFGPPGKHFNYSNPGLAMVSYAITAALQRHPGPKDLLGLLTSVVMDPIGASPQGWALGNRHTVITQDGLNLTLYSDWGEAAYDCPTAARVGRLMLQGGKWDGRVVIPRPLVTAGWAEHAGVPEPYGGRPPSCTSSGH